MNHNKYLIFVYKKIAQGYNFIFARKNMQFINNIIFSLSLGAKGYKNYGSFSSTGEKNFIKLISKEIRLSLDVGANVGKYTRLILEETDSEVIAFEPLPEAFNKIEEIRKIFSSRLLTYRVALGNENIKRKINYSNETSEKASLDINLEKISFIGKKIFTK